MFFFDIKSYLVTYHWKGLLTIQIMTHLRGFYDIAGLNSSLSKYNFDGVPFQTRLTNTHVNFTIVYLPPSCLKKGIFNNGLTIKIFILPYLAYKLPQIMAS